MKIFFICILTSYLLNYINSKCGFTSTSTMISYNCKNQEPGEICERTFNIPEDVKIDIVYNFGCDIKIDNKKVYISSKGCNNANENACFVNLYNKIHFKNIEKNNFEELTFLEENENYIEDQKLNISSICEEEQDCNNNACYC